LGGGYPLEVATVGTTTTIIQDSISFVDGQTSMEYGVNSMLIQNVSDEEVLRGLMVDVSTIVLRDMRPKILCLKVDENVSIPGAIRGDVEKVFIGKICIDR
jgi:hypothetical protein